MPTRTTPKAKPRTRTGKPLAEYDAKRDFKKSPEPAARVAKKAGRSFCVQKHLASHLHYDFRLEHNGVLLSWAVPKGPSLNPADKRMAVHVEDHPVEYGKFEGIIPSGYGAGIVMLWDAGTWSPEPGFEDVDAALKKGELKFRVDGVKLKGSWVLIRTHRQASAGREQWLLIKHRDAWSGDIDVTTVAPDSVKSFGDHAAIAAANDEVVDWRRTPPAKGGDAGKMFVDVLKRAAEIRNGGRGGVAMKKSVWDSNPGAKAAKRSAARVGAERTTKLAALKTTAPKAKASKTPANKASTSAAVPKLTNQSKVLFPKTGFTKGDLVGYYQRIAPLILPHLIGRAATLKRYPDGVDGKFFFEKNCNIHRPDWVKTITVPTGTGKVIDYCEIADTPTLIWAANLAAIELHVPLALGAEPLRPTAMVFDLDPGAPATLRDCVAVALRLKGMFDELKLKSVIKTSGGKGLHLLVPLNTPGVTFDDTKAFARAVAMTLERDDPKRVIASMSRAAREGKVFIDWSQNDRNKTTVCVYSVRAREEPTVSWPVEWDALTSRKLPAPVRADQKTFDLEGAKRFDKAMLTKQRLPKHGLE